MDESAGQIMEYFWYVCLFIDVNFCVCVCIYMFVCQSVYRYSKSILNHLAALDTLQLCPLLPSLIILECLCH
jgi:hypothetical protein